MDDLLFPVVASNLLFGPLIDEPWILGSRDVLHIAAIKASPQDRARDMHEGNHTHLSCHDNARQTASQHHVKRVIYVGQGAQKPCRNYFCCWVIEPGKGATDCSCNLFS